MEYKPIYVQTGSQRTFISAPSRTPKQFSYLCWHFPSQEEVWQQLQWNLESLCLQMVKVLERYLHRARSAGCVVTVNRKMKEGMESSQGIQLQGQQKCQVVVDVGRAETNKEMLVINVITARAMAMHILHGSKLLVQIMICYQTPTVYREHYCVQGALLCAGSTPGPKANTGSIQFGPLPFKAAHCVLLQRINQVIKLFRGTWQNADSWVWNISWSQNL